MNERSEFEQVRTALQVGESPTGRHTWSQVVAQVGRRQRRRRAARIGAPILAVALVAAIAGVFVVRDDDVSRLETGAIDRPDERSDLPLPSGTETVLVMSDGYGGAHVVDVDRGMAKHIDLPGATPGDFEVRLARVGDRIVYPGRPGTYALPLNLEGQPSLLGDSIYFLPANDNEHVWLLTGEEPGQTQLGRPLLARRVDVSAGAEEAVGPFAVPLSMDTPERRFSAAATAASTASLILDFTDGRRLWQPEAEVTPIPLGGHCALPASVDDGFVIVADGKQRCDSLEILDEQGETVASFPAEGRLLTYSLVPSPDGTLVVTEVGDSSGSNRAVTVLDRATGEWQDIVGYAPRDYGIVWSPSGKHLFVVSAIQDDPMTQKVTVVDIDSMQPTAAFEVPVSAAGSVIALRADEIDLGQAVGRCSELGSTLGVAAGSLPSTACFLTEAARSASPPITLDDGEPPADAMSGPLPDGRSWYLWTHPARGLCVAAGDTFIGCGGGSPTALAPDRSEPLVAAETPAVGAQSFGFLAYGFLPTSAVDVFFESATGARSQAGRQVDETNGAWAIPVDGNVGPVAVVYVDADGVEVGRFPLETGPF